MSASQGSPFGRAPAKRVRGDILATIYPLRRLRRHLSQRERLFVSPIISQIGRENKFSAENYVSRTVEDAGPYKKKQIFLREAALIGTFLFYLIPVISQLFYQGWIVLVGVVEVKVYRRAVGSRKAVDDSGL